MTVAELNIEFSTLPRAPRGSPQTGETLRLVILGDFMGDGETPAPALHPCDPSTFAPLIAHLKPQVRLAPSPADEPAMQFESLADFHPERLLHRPPLAQLKSLRDALDTPPGLAQALELLQHATADAASPAPPAPPPEQPSSPNGDEEAADDTLERLLGRRSTGAPTPNDPKAKAQQFVASLLSRPGHASPAEQATGDQAHRAREGLDALITKTLRSVLAQPALRRTEAMWRMTHELVTELEFDDTLSVQLLPTSKHALAADLERGSAAPGASEIARLLQQAADDGATLLVVAAFAVHPTPVDVAWLSRLAAALVPLGATLVADASPQLVGAADADQLSDPTRWQALPDDFQHAWAALRASPLGAKLGLVLPSLLARLPYGARGEVCDAFPFEELATVRTEEGLWGSPALALGHALAQRWLEQAGASARAEGPLTLDDRPHYARRCDGEMRVLAPTRCTLSERAVQSLEQQGVMAWSHPRDSTLVRLHALLALNGERLAIP